MIYKKDANFPYPLLTNTSNSYDGCNFTLDIELNENIKTIPKNRISLSKRTTIQLLIQSKEEINFKDNHDLNSFYGSIKDQINVPKHSILGFSNSVMFDGSTAKPLELFEKKVDINLKSEVKVELGSETIIINYKSDELQFIDSPVSSTINNIYVYMGLQKALYRFVNTYGQEDEEVDLEELDLPTDGLDMKLYRLMKSKMIKSVSLDNVDEVISSITDRILEKYTSAVRGLYSNGN